MAINTKWDDSNQTRILMEFETTWTLNDLYEALEKTDSFLAGVSHRVDVIIDLEGAEIPKDYLNMAKLLLTNPDMQMRPNEGNRVVVGANKWIRTAYSTLQKTFSKYLEGREVLFANDLSHARGIIYSMRLDG